MNLLEAHKFIKDSFQQDLEEGAEFPPVVVFGDGLYYWLADGFHRFYAHQRAKRVTINAVECNRTPSSIAPSL